MTHTIYERGVQATIFATFVTTSGEAATLTGTPTISIYHLNSTVKTDVNSQDMIQLSDTTYYYHHYFEKNADLGEYVAKFTASYDTGETVIGEQTIYLVEKGWFKNVGKGGTGSVQLRQTPQKFIWSVKEKEDLLKAIVSIKERVDALESSTRPLKLIDDINTTLGAVKASIGSIEADNKVDNDEIYTQLTELRDKISSIKPEEKLERRLAELSEDIEVLGKMVLRTIPDEHLESLESEVKDNGPEDKT